MPPQLEPKLRRIANGFKAGGRVARVHSGPVRNASSPKRSRRTSRNACARSQRVGIPPQPNASFSGERTLTASLGCQGSQESTIRKLPKVRKGKRTSLHLYLGARVHRNPQRCPSVPPSLPTHVRIQSQHERPGLVIHRKAS